MASEKGGLLRRLATEGLDRVKFNKFKEQDSSKRLAEAAGLDLDDFNKQSDFEDTYDRIIAATDAGLDLAVKEKEAPAKIEKAIATTENIKNTQPKVAKAIEEAEGGRLASVTQDGTKTDFPLSAKEKRQEAVDAGKKAGIAEGFERAEGIKRAVKKIGSISRQFDEAMPDRNKLFPQLNVEDRIGGFIDIMGAKTGLKPNPKLFALQRTAKLTLRSILRDMGEGARMSDQDIEQNIAAVELADNSPEERRAIVQTFIQTAVDAFDDDTLGILREDSGSVKLLNEFGIKLPGGDGSLSVPKDIPTFETSQGMIDVTPEVKKRAQEILRKRGLSNG